MPAASDIQIPSSWQPGIKDPMHCLDFGLFAPGAVAVVGAHPGPDPMGTGRRALDPAVRGQGLQPGSGDGGGVRPGSGPVGRPARVAPRPAARRPGAVAEVTAWSRRRGVDGVVDEDQPTVDRRWRHGPTAGPPALRPRDTRFSEQTRASDCIRSII